MPELYNKDRVNTPQLQKQKARKFHPSRLISVVTGNWLEIVSVVLLLVTLGIAIRSIEESHWITPQPSLTLILVVSVFTTLLLAKSRLPAVVSFPVCILAGAAVIVWQGSAMLPVETDSIIDAWQSLWQAINTGQPTTIYFAVFLIFFIWLSGAVSTWFIIRKRIAWVAVIIGIITVLVNLRYLTEDYYFYLILYILAAMLLVSQVSVLKRKCNLGRNFPVRGVLRFIMTGVILSSLLVAGNWIMPEFKTQELRASIGARMPWANGNDFGASWINVFASVEAKQSLLVSSSQDKLSFAGVTDSRRDIQFEISSSERVSYWRIRRYDTYNSWGWSTKSAVPNELPGKTLIDSPFPKYRSLTFTVQNKLNTDILLSSGELTSAQMPVKLFTANAGLEAGEIIAMSSTRILNYGESYTLTSAVSLATPAELAKAGQNYPRTITDRYLQLPSDLPQRLRQLSRTITRLEQTPYDKVLAVIKYLSKTTYNESGSSPPQGSDGVDHFIFTAKSGNCTNFASATIVLLRAADIPARFTTGYLAREWDKGTGTTIIRARDYHAWVEVYFPGYGWMEFETTPLGNSDDGGTIAGNLINVNSAVNVPPVEDTSEFNSSDSTTGANNGTDAPIGEPLDIFDVGLGGWQSAGELPLLPITTGILASSLLALMLLRLRRFGFNKGDYSQQVYARMCFLAALVRLSPKAQQTPLEYSARLALAFPIQSVSIDHITRAYTGSRFSRTKETKPDDKKKLSQSWHIVSRAFLKRLFLPH